MIGFAALGEARTTRQGRGVATAVAVLMFVALRMAGVAATSLAATEPRAAILALALPLVACAVCLDAIFRRPAQGRADPRAIGRAQVCLGESDVILGTLGRYFARRFFATILAVFAGVFVLIFAIDLVETLRRSGDTPGATPLLMAWLSLLHTPIVAEQALPFAVLFGAMISFLNLSRRLELVVARAAGVSVWQFLAPPVLIALAIGIAVTCLYNPVSTSMKRQANASRPSCLAPRRAGRPGCGSARRALTATQSCTRTGARTPKPA